MNIVYFGNGIRAQICLEALLEANYNVSHVIVHPGLKGTDPLSQVAIDHNLEILAPDNPNDDEFLDRFRKEPPDLFVLGGYGKILKQEAINVPKNMTINLHGGALPEYRGSSPLNWVLIKGEQSFKTSIIEVDEGIDTGPVLIDREHPIGINDTIKDLHDKANSTFPEMLLAVLAAIEEGNLQKRIQDNSRAAYYPLRFPEDGFILFDQLTALEVHNRIRALTDPYPGAFCYYNNRKVKLLLSRLHDAHFHGEPGRIYRRSKGEILVCAKDKSLWITDAVFDESGTALYDEAKRYEQLSTVRGAVLNTFKS